MPSARLINKARSNGYALLEQQIAQRVRGIAVPIRTRDGIVVGSISVSLADGQRDHRERRCAHAAAVARGRIRAARGVLKVRKGGYLRSLAISAKTNFANSSPMLALYFSTTGFSFVRIFSSSLRASSSTSSVLRILDSERSCASRDTLR